ncbi:hypothetical protein E1B28_001341 [Marasmius oreades]|uniref:Anti-proliferative protein domain-containing protein n=1 Tax=Marasmius oreades TaxID=181124 RepID=A0A9P8AFJ3_9AGAR|nr:uncharacterized protein E1B28_001341 [Marasmius oreades]KAG7099495.1 hypothetical protein E1B28_001341 [Marasmius oreades]
MSQLTIYQARLGIHFVYAGKHKYKDLLFPPGSGAHIISRLDFRSINLSLSLVSLFFAVTAPTLTFHSFVSPDDPLHDQQPPLELSVIALALDLRLSTQMASSTSASLSVTLAHAISYLTSCLHGQVAPCKITKLQLVLEANLTAHYASTWTPSEPLRGSGRRCLTLSPECLPPRVIYSACIAAGVQWFDWINALGGQECDFFVDPGCVSLRVGRTGGAHSRLITVWADEIPSPTVAPFPFKVQGKTIAQQLMESDDDDSEHMFAMIAHETAKPTTWMTSMLNQFPIPTRSTSPLSTSSSHSRCSSRSSDSSFSVDSRATASSAQSVDRCRPSRRERARQAKVFVDSSKTEVTQYEGGRTTVLTGGVMLGGSASKGKSRCSPTQSPLVDWRSVRA